MYTFQIRFCFCLNPFLFGLRKPFESTDVTWLEGMHRVISAAVEFVI